MKDKQAIKILINLRNKYLLDIEEKEALSNAIGILSWSTLAESGIKGLKAKREKENNF